MTDNAQVLPARLHGADDLLPPRVQRHLDVIDPDAGLVSVRWLPELHRPWRCRECGPQATPECSHTFSAALELAEHLLGLTRMPNLQPTPTIERNHP